MAIREYKDFIIVADDVEKTGRTVEQFTVSIFDSPVGQGEFKEPVNVPKDLAGQLGRLDRRQYDEDMREQIKIGQSLADMLLPPYARKLFGESLKRLRDDEGLRIRLRLDDELADYPWEYIYIQDHRGEPDPGNFLMLDPRVSIVRHEALAVPGDWFESPAGRRMIVAMASPDSKKYNPLRSLPGEQAALKSALDHVKGLDTVWLPESYGAGNGATLENLMAELMTRTDIFHFSGHGEFIPKGPGFGKKIGEGAIVLCDETNKPFPISAERFASEVLRGKGIRLVVLGACESGRRDGHNVWSGVAASILKAGIPAVVAMQYTIRDNLAAAFNGAFYRALVAGLLIDEAVALGRLAIRAEALKTGDPDIRDWGVPVLYLRAPGGRVFNPVSDASACQAAEQELGNTIRQHVREVAPDGQVIGANIGVMEGQLLKIDQKVSEELKGVMIGSNVYQLKNGRISIKQEADVVSGQMVGLSIGNFGGNFTAVEPEKKALAQLKDLLRVKETSGDSKFCSDCGTGLESSDKFCPQCGKKMI